MLYSLVNGYRLRAIHPPTLKYIHAPASRVTENVVATLSSQFAINFHNYMEYSGFEAAGVMHGWRCAAVVVVVEGRNRGTSLIEF